MADLIYKARWWLACELFARIAPDDLFATVWAALDMMNEALDDEEVNDG